MHALLVYALLFIPGSINSRSGMMLLSRELTRCQGT